MTEEGIDMMVNAVLIVVHVIASLILILFVLLHAAGGGLSDMFGGVSGGIAGRLDRGGTQPRPDDGHRVARLHVHHDPAVAAIDLTGQRRDCVV